MPPRSPELTTDQHVCMLNHVTPDVLDAVATMLGGVVVLAPLVAWRLA